MKYYALYIIYIYITLFILFNYIKIWSPDHLKLFQFKFCNATHSTVNFSLTERNQEWKNEFDLKVSHKCVYPINHSFLNLKKKNEKQISCIQVEMRVPKRPFDFQFKNEKWKMNYMYPNGHLFFKLKMRNEKIIFLSLNLFSSWRNN